MIRKILFIGIFICLLSCGFSTVGGDPPPAWECKGTLKVHPKMLKLELDLTYSSLFFGAVYHSDSSHLCYADYEYKFVSKKTTEKIHKNSALYNVLDSEEHVRFSLFDKNNVEKSYDIDLSEIIHSYTFKGDSVEIKMPSEGLTKILLECPYCTYNKERVYDNLCQGYFACNYQSSEMSTVMIGTDSTWDTLFVFHQYLGNQSSMKTDSIKVFGTIAFR
ncbi:hypothetical protein [Fibrobacter sp.]|uniref:hypothetical protein n=1 Tax=Fibrobacter sp. TaxID=35828 RepID=UPI002607BA95|nr:hypothetical protein [Fibrobacter sp.]MDD5943509.1 hypothetical protein [Fibrobacter sp.]